MKLKLAQAMRDKADSINNGNDKEFESILKPIKESIEKAAERGEYGCTVNVYNITEIYNRRLIRYLDNEGFYVKIKPLKDPINSMYTYEYVHGFGHMPKINLELDIRWM